MIEILAALQRIKSEPKCLGKKMQNVLKSVTW